MGLFGFKKKEIEVPKPSETKKEAVSDRHNDDLDKPTPVLQGPLFPEMPKLDLPELEAPEEKPIEIKLPEIKIPEMPPKMAIDKKEIPDELPELELPELGILKAPKRETSILKFAIPESLPDIEDFEYKPKKQKPVFMDIRRYASMVEELNQMKTKIMDYATVSGKMTEIKDEKERAMEKYRHSLEDMERKLLYVDRVLFEGG